MGGMESDCTFLVQNYIASMNEAQGSEHGRCLVGIYSWQQHLCRTQV